MCAHLFTYELNGRASLHRSSGFFLLFTTTSSTVLYGMSRNLRMPSFVPTKNVHIVVCSPFSPIRPKFVVVHRRQRPMKSDTCTTTRDHYKTTTTAPTTKAYGKIYEHFNINLDGLLIVPTDWLPFVLCNEFTKYSSNFRKNRTGFLSFRASRNEDDENRLAKTAMNFDAIAAAVYYEQSYTHSRSRRQ